jgi:uncharacterized RDD family membrane protein YckC
MGRSDGRRTDPAPIRRFVARMVDMLILASILIPLSFSLWALGAVAIFIIPVCIMGGLLAAESLCLSRFGTTPGKHLLGLRVEALDGDNPTFREAFVRTIQVYVYGKGLFIPIVSGIATLVSLSDLVRKGATRWDRDQFVVTFGSITPVRWVILGCLAAAFVVVGNLPEDYFDQPITSAAQASAPISAEHQDEKNRFAAIVQRFQEVEAIYKEGDRIMKVYVHDVEVDNWGVKAHVHALSAPGFSDVPVKDQWDISAAWDVFSCTDSTWHARYSGWRIHFDRKVVEKMTGYAAGIASEAAESRREKLEIEFAAIDRL